MGHELPEELPKLPGRHEAEERDARIPGVRVSQVRVRSDRSSQGKCAGKPSCARPRLTAGGVVTSCPVAGANSRFSSATLRRITFARPHSIS
jgi:hypothetical protein